MLTSVGLSVPALAADIAAATSIEFQIPASSLADALSRFGLQSGMQVVYASALTRGLKSRPVAGRLTTDAALKQLLDGTGITWRYVDGGTVVLQHADPTSNIFSGDRRDVRAADGANTGMDEVLVTGVPEVLVRGSKVLNMDIVRSRDDAQPYVIFERETIERSGADTLEEFLKYRLPMNTQGVANHQQPGTTFGTASLANLRGLGAAQTLVLIDGRRVPAFSSPNGPTQADLNNIPLGAIERVEVLPTTASGIYGGGATGGVINVILRRDYRGAELTLSYENTFDTDAAIRRLDLSGGFHLEGGRTDVLFAGSYSDQNPLLAEDRDFERRARERILVNNPAVLVTNPPLGATTNIRSTNGSPLFGPGTPSFTSVPAGYAGGGGLQPLRANAGTYNLDVPNNAGFSFMGFSGGKRWLLNTPVVSSLTASVRRQMSPRVDLFVDLGASRNEGNGLTQTGGSNTIVISAAAPNNPFGQAITVMVPVITRAGITKATNDIQRVIAGVIFKLPADWMAEADYTWARFRSGFVTTEGLLSTQVASAIGNGTIDVLRDLNVNPVDWESWKVSPAIENPPFPSTLKDATVRLAGPVGALPAGRPAVSLLLERRDELFAETQQVQYTVTPVFFAFFPDRSQSVTSGYAEARLPIISAPNRIRGVRELELQLAVRRDAYEVHGATGFVSSLTPGAPVVRTTNRSNSTDYTIGLRFEPVEDLILRASYGTGFFPPSVARLITNPTVATANVLDPRRGNNPASAPLTSGGNPDLLPEHSESLSAGAVFTPRFLPNARLSVDYTLIEKVDGIASLTAQQVVDNESAFPNRVTRGPVTSGDPFEVGPIIAINNTAANLAEAKVEAFDVVLDYRLEAGPYGDFDFSSVATWQTHLLTRLAPSEPVIENVGVGANNPLKFKANFNLSWQMRAWTFAWSTRYLDSYLAADPASAAGRITLRSQGGSGRVPHQFYHDFSARYAFGSGSRAGKLGSALANTEVKLAVQNVLNEEPPFDAGVAFGVGFYSPFGDPRLASYQVSVRKQF